MALDEINPANPHLFRENRWHDHFARLRAEDPVHFNETEAAGRYWSVTSYDDVKTVDGDWKTYSSTSGIILTPKDGDDMSAINPGLADAAPFIEMDPPRHTEQRKTVRSVSAPANLRNLEPQLRARTIELLDDLPVGEPFDWVQMVSVELTTWLLANLFDFPYEDRHKLTRWSDLVFAVPEPGGIVETSQQKMEELMECAIYFGGSGNSARRTPATI